MENVMLSAGVVPNGQGWKKGQHPAVISEDLARRIEDMRRRRKLGAPSPRPVRIYFLSSALICRNCGSKLYEAGPINGHQ